MKGGKETVREKGLEAFVDSINNGVCRLLIGVQSTPVDMPLHLLPVGTSEGSRLLIKFTELPKENNSNKRKIDELLKGFHEEFVTKVKENKERSVED